MVVKDIKSLFGSNTRVKLFELFFSNPESDYYVREITRLIDEQINSVRRELLNLQQSKVIKKSKRDNKVYYGVNPNFKDYLAFAMIFDKDFDKSSLSKSTVAEIANEVNVQAGTQQPKLDWNKLIEKVNGSIRVLVLGGSLVTGSQANIDMLIVGDNKNQVLSQWASKIEKIKGCDLNYSILTS